MFAWLAVQSSVAEDESVHDVLLWQGLFLGFGLGVLVSAVGARWLVIRYVRRVRAADKRARRVQRLAELGSMTRGLAHEIKNPLSTIGLNVQLLEEAIEDLELDEQTKGPLMRRLGSLGREVDRLRGILTDFLDYAGELRLEPHMDDLNTVIDELVDFFLPQAAQLGVRVREDLCEGPLPAWIDSQHIKQAVLNLLLNALHAIEDKAKQTDSNHAVGGPDELIIRSERGFDEDKQPVAVLHVIDTGPGMDGQLVNNIFTPYFTTKSGGSGLGLPTARRIIEAHHGSIEVLTEPGKGTDFVLTLPAEPIPFLHESSSESSTDT